MTGETSIIQYMGIFLVALCGGAVVYIFKEYMEPFFVGRRNLKQIKDYYHDRDKALEVITKDIVDKYSTEPTESLIRPEKGEYIKPKS